MAMGLIKLLWLLLDNAAEIALACLACNGAVILTMIGGFGLLLMAWENHRK